ncbi:MAG: hypothetical protein ACRETL_04260, partial [Gammaproteobacteria bacterium]
YKRYGYLALCISGAGLHARTVVKAEADNRPEMGQKITSRGTQLIRDFKGTKIAHYDKWDFSELPTAEPADKELFTFLGNALAKKTGGIDVGFGWNIKQAIKLDRAELLDAFRELEPLYRVIRSV